MTSDTHSSPAPLAPYDHDLERGMRNRRQILGDAWVDRSIGNATAFSADFQAFITRYAWHEVWGRPGLELKTRRLLVLVITTALGRWEEFELHCRASLAGGDPATRLTPEEIKEALIQTAIYAGVPAANTAHAITAKLLRELGASDHPDAAMFAAQVAPRAATEAVHTGTGREGRTCSKDSAGGHPAIAYSVLEPRQRRADGTDGAAPLTIVLSHALGCDRMMWDGLAADLSAEHRVVTYDHRGHGASAAPPGAYTLDELADDAARVIDATAPPGERVVFIGLSMGGMVGQLLALRRPERVRALVLANTSSGYPAEAREVWRQRITTIEAQGLAAIADATMQRWFTEPFRAAQAATVARVRRRVVSQDPLGYIGCCHAISALDLTDRLPAIACPALVIAGAEDLGTPPAMAETIARQIPGAQYLLLPQASHQSVIEQPVAFTLAVRTFLAGLASL
jgi:3-oxoadipate enol-lactonase